MEIQGEYQTFEPCPLDGRRRALRRPDVRFAQKMPNRQRAAGPQLGATRMSCTGPVAVKAKLSRPWANPKPVALMKASPNVQKRETKGFRGSRVLKASRGARDS